MEWLDINPGKGGRLWKGRNGENEEDQMFFMRGNERKKGNKMRIAKNRKASGRSGMGCAGSRYFYKGRRKKGAKKNGTYAGYVV